MRPLRIELQGFMTHRERTTLDFRGDWLWAITGANGSGKSAVFDAITYALYGQHRYCESRTATHDECLLSQGRDFLRVAFDFEVDGRGYRVERTMARRRGRTGATYSKTYQAYSIDPDDLEPDSAAALSGTDSSRGLQEWVLRTLGVSYAAFVSAILLKQGEAERFVSAQASARQSILLEMLDLKPYVRLEEVAKKQAHDLRVKVEMKEADLAPLAAVSEEAVLLARESHQKLTEELQATGRRVEAAVNALSLSEEYARNLASLAEVRAELDALEAVLRDADAIEQDSRERQQLETAIPTLRRALQLKGKAQQASEQAAYRIGQANAIDLATLRSLSDKRAKHASDLRRRLDEARQKARQARELENRMRPLFATARHRSQLRSDYADTQEQLDQLECGLTDRDQWEQHRRRCEDAAIARTSLEDLQAHKSALIDADAQIRRLVSETVELERAVADLNQQAAQARDDEADAQTECQRLEHDLAVVGTKLVHTREEIQSREEAAHEGTCSRCGQRVDQEHIARELREARHAESELQGEVEDLENRLGEAREHAAACTDAVIDVGEALSAAQDRQSDANIELSRQRERHSTAEKQASSCLARLPERYAILVAEPVFPSPTDIEETRSLALAVPKVQETCRRLQAVASQIDLLRSQQSQRLEQIEEIECQHTPTHLDTAETQYAMAQQGLQRADEVESQLQSENDIASVAADEAIDNFAEAEKSQAKFFEDAETCRSAAEASLSTATALLETLEDAWHDLNRVHEETVARLEIRWNELADAAERQRRLDDARSSTDQLRGRSVELEKQLEAIPKEYRVMSEEARRQLEHERQERDSLQRQAGGAGQILTQLESNLRQKRSLEEELDTLRQERADYRELARLFGKEMLQAWLVQEAQESITLQANQFLSNISNGMLRLELKREGEELELLVTDLTSGDEPINVAGVSGSQRFRVSVALALAVGEYSGQGSRRIRSVIIDEGFGGLDELGRTEMIDQIKNLCGLLDCVILVSHQDAFHDAFPNGYHVEKCRTISTVTARHGGVVTALDPVVSALN